MKCSDRKDLLEILAIQTLRFVSVSIFYRENFCDALPLYKTFYIAQYAAFNVAINIENGTITLISHQFRFFFNYIARILGSSFVHLRAYKNRLKNDNRVQTIRAWRIDRANAGGLIVQLFTEFSSHDNRPWNCRNTCNFYNRVITTVQLQLENTSEMHVNLLRSKYK